MKDLFYGLLSFILLGIMFNAYKEMKKQPNKLYELTNISKSIIIDKNNDLLYGKHFYIKKINSDSIELIRVYGIVYEQYEISDTIN